MIVGTASIRKRLKTAWPNLKFIMLTDPQFYRPRVLSVREQLNAFDPGQFIANFRACEETAMEFMLKTRKLWPPNGEPVNWAVGWVFALECKVTTERHFLNLVDAEEGLFLVDARSKQIWSPSDADKVVWLVM
jgi:hypothetical protein